MPIAWTDYDSYDWQSGQQTPLADEARATIEQFAADILELPTNERMRCWGCASAPGRFAATVIHVAPDVPHRYCHRAARFRSGAVGVKVFKITADAQREARRLVPFHGAVLERLPGLPNDRVQRSIDAGIRLDRQGAERAFVVQEWIAGSTLAALLRHHGPEQPLDAPTVRSILEQLLGGLVIPLWSAGTVWWDVRDANYCYEARSGRLAMIDVDSLAAYAQEILGAPHVWEKRDKGRRTALARLRQMAIRVVRSQWLAKQRHVATECTAAWRRFLEPALIQLGKGPDRSAAAQAALGSFLGELSP